MLLLLLLLLFLFLCSCDVPPQPDGLQLDHFVSVMMKYLPPAQDPVKSARDLCELFAQVDVNGDGTMEWGEFSAFCIEAGMAANQFKARKEWRYIEYTDATRLTPHGLHITRVRYEPKLQKMVRARRGGHSGWR